MDTEKKQKQLDLEEEYMRIAENEEIYFDEIALWKKLGKITRYLALFSFVPIFLATFTLPYGTDLLEAFPDYPLQVSTVFVGFGLAFTFLIASLKLSWKVLDIRSELGLHEEERLYLCAYETHKNIDAFLTESNPKRKLYFKKLVLESAQEMTKIIGEWEYGNVRLVSELVGNQVDLMKDNMRRLVLSNVARGDDATVLKKISNILVELCRYILSPSVERLSELNVMIGELPFKEYKFLTKKEKIGEYFYGKPRMFRLLFACGVTISVAVVLLCLGQNIGVIFAVAVPTFWGAFAGFDKLFRLKEERSK